MKILKTIIVALVCMLTVVSVPSVFAALNPDPIIFDITAANDYVEAMVTDGETLYVGGAFTAIDGTARNGFAAFDIATQTLLPLDIELVAGEQVVVYAMALDGETLYVGGDFTAVNGVTTRTGLAAVNTTTGVATAFNPVLDGSVNRLLVDNGVLYVVGSFSCVGEYVESCDGEADVRNGVAAFSTATGELTDFNPNIEFLGEGGSRALYALEIDGTILYVGGSFDTVNGNVARSNIAAFDTTTSTTTSFDPGTLDDTVTDLLIDGNVLYASGNFTTVGDGVARNRMAAFNVDEGFIEVGHVYDFDPDINGTAYRMYLDESDDTLYVAGSFTTVNGGVARNSMAAFDSGGTVTDFDPDFNDTNNEMIADAEGNLFVAGVYTQVGGVAANGIVYFEVEVDETAPTISTLSPTDNAVDVAIDTTLVITFDETVVASSTGDIVLYTSDDVLVETIPANDAQVSVADDEVTITLTDDLENGTSYYVQIDAGSFEDASGNQFAGIADTTTWNFSTVAEDEEESSGGGGSSSSRRHDMSSSSGQRDPIVVLMQELVGLLQQLLEQLIAEQQSQ